MTSLRSVRTEVGMSEGRVNTLLISLPTSHDRRNRLFYRLDPRQWNLSILRSAYPPVRSSMNDHEWTLFRQMAGHLTAGQRGCFLSHRRAWLSAAKSMDKITVILEDDAVPLYKRLPKLPNLPEDTDVLYLHHFAQHLPSSRRLLLSLIRTMLLPFRNPFEYIPISEVTTSHCGKLNRAAMPASAYAVTQKGAKKLLSVFSEVGVFYKWDSIMLRNSLPSRAFNTMLPYLSDDKQSFYIGQRPGNASQKIASTFLKAYAIYPPITIHDYLTVSEKDRLNHQFLDVAI